MDLFIKRHTHVDMAKARQTTVCLRRNTKTITEDDIDSLLELAELYNTAMILNQQNVWAILTRSGII